MQEGPYDSPSDWTPISYQPVADKKGGESSIRAEQTGHMLQVRTCQETYCSSALLSSLTSRKGPLTSYGHVRPF